MPLQDFSLKDKIEFHYAFSDGHKGVFSGTVMYVLHAHLDKACCLVVKLDTPYKKYREVLVNPWWSKAEKTGETGETDTTPKRELNDKFSTNDFVHYHHKESLKKNAHSGTIDYIVNGGENRDDITGVIFKRTDQKNQQSDQEYILIDNYLFF